MKYASTTLQGLLEHYPKSLVQRWIRGKDRSEISVDWILWARPARRRPPTVRKTCPYVVVAELQAGFPIARVHRWAKLRGGVCWKSAPWDDLSFAAIARAVGVSRKTAVRAYPRDRGHKADPAHNNWDALGLGRLTVRELSALPELEGVSNRGILLAMARFNMPFPPPGLGPNPNL